jgi:hypothetical protein
MEWFLATTPEGARDTTFGWLKACEAESASSILKKAHQNTLVVHPTAEQDNSW